MSDDHDGYTIDIGVPTSIGVEPVEHAARYDMPATERPDIVIKTSNSHADLFTRNMTSVHVGDPVYKVGAYTVVSRGFIEDAGMAGIHRVINAQLDRYFRPWLYADRNPMPVIDLFPRWTRLERRWHGWMDRLRARKDDDLW